MTTDERLTTLEDVALRAVIERALIAHHDSDRVGIAAAVIFEDKIIATAENEVHQTHNPTQHAEIVALRLATEALGQDDLSGCILISTLQPCEMCLAATRFAGIDRIIFSAQQENVAAKYFVFPKLKIADFCSAGTPFSYVGGVREEEVLHLYENAAE